MGAPAAEHFAGGADAQSHDHAIHRRADGLTLHLVLRGTQAFFELAQRRRRLLELFGGGLLITVARVGHARLQFAGTLARQGQLAARFIQAAARIGVRALQRQQPRARHVTVFHQLLVEREFFGGETAGFANRFDLASQRR